MSVAPQTEVIQADVMEWAASYDGPKFHAMLCDPPYELGFMGKAWDKSGIAYRPETWAALAAHLHPGAFIMAFSSTRTYHRMACAMEDAGLVAHPMMGWLFGSGFPKATRVTGADDFDGHRYGGQALKPALEPVAVFQVTYAGKPRECIVATGAGALNIDGGRVAGDKGWPTSESTLAGWNKSGPSLPTEPRGDGRWPANVVLTHHAECNGECHPHCPVRIIGEQSGESVSAAPGGHYGCVGEGPGVAYGGALNSSIPKRAPIGDTGTAARYFHQSRWDDADPFFYCPKASTSEREAGLDGPRQCVGDGRDKSIDNAYQRGETPRLNVHPTVKPLDLCRHLATLLLPPARYAPRRLLVPFCGSGSEMIGACDAGWEHVVGVEMTPEYVELARARLAHYADKRQLSLFDAEEVLT